MPFSTKRETLTNQWKEIGADGTTSLHLQLGGGKSAMIYVGSEAPAANSGDGFTLSTAGSNSLPLNNLDGEKVFARAVGGTASIMVLKN